MKRRRLKTHLSIGLLAGTLSSSALAISCSTDCDGFAAWRYPCGVTGWPPETKWCDGVDPFQRNRCIQAKVVLGCGFNPIPDRASIRLPVINGTEVEWENAKLENPGNPFIDGAPVNYHFRKVYKSIGKSVAKDPEVIDEARRKGWSYESCRNIGVPFIGAVVTIKYSGICTAFAPPVGPTGCLAALTAGAGAIAFAACEQLCTDQHLSDCHN